MVIIAAIYLALVYLLFFRLKLLPWNGLSQGLTVLIGVIILTGFLVGLQGLTPSSVHSGITGRVVEIAPQVSGRVSKVPVKANVRVDEGDILFEIDPVPYEARVQEIQAQLELAKLRLQQVSKLAAANAATQFERQRASAEVKRFSAQLVGAEFDLSNTVVRAPARGEVSRVFLVPGMQVSPSRSVMAFVDTEELTIVAAFQQKALQSVRIGDKALVNFPALPGRVFETQVVGLPSAIGEGQLFASGALPSVGEVSVTRLYPAFIAIPDDFPKHLRKIGLAATVYIHTEGAGVVGIVAVVLQWLGTSLDAII